MSKVKVSTEPCSLLKAPGKSLLYASLMLLVVADTPWLVAASLLFPPPPSPGTLLSAISVSVSSSLLIRTPVLLNLGPTPIQEVLLLT